MSTALTTLAIFTSFLAALLLYCMLCGLRAITASLRPRAAALTPIPRSSSRYPSAAPAYHSPSKAQFAMFKKAIDSHNATKSQANPAQQLFSSNAIAPHQAKLSQSTLQKNAAGPLSNGTGNAVRASVTGLANGASGRRTYASATGLKRTSSGLVKALDTHDAFAEPAAPKGNSQQNPHVIEDVPPVKKSSSYEAAKQAVYFDENDFDSDIDLDVEDPATKGSINYPSLPAVSISAKPGPAAPPAKPTSASKTNIGKFRPFSHIRPTRTREDTYDSGYFSQRTESVDPAPITTQPIPWSSSPPEHLEAHPQAAELRKFMYSSHEDEQDKSRLTKRRTLPWVADEERERASVAKDDFTPLPKNETNTKHPWNTTATKIKEMQKIHRETQKTKTAKKTDGLLDEFKKKKSLSRVFLSDEQQNVLNLVVEGKKSVFFTGSAGTGKSVLLREIISSLKKKYARESDRVAVTASTGLAACNIGGVTLHSFAGIGLGKEPVEELVKKIKRNQKSKHRWMRVKVLVVDEVSMIDGELFDKLENCARILRNNGRPFGGIQLIITGDFFQLPPVAERNSIAKFSFDAASWNTTIEHTIGLTHVFRQKDPVFAGMLNEMREGRLTPSSVDVFKKLNRPITLEGPFEATELFPTRSEVDAANRKKMSMLHGEVRTFEAKDGGSITDKAFRDKLLSSCMAPEVVHLKKGAQVMLIKNIDDTLVNGSLGRVIGFMSEQMFDSYQANEEEFLQGRDTGANGNGYDDDDADRIEARKRQKIAELLASTSQLYPVVRFSLQDGTTRDLLCQREMWKHELPNGEVQASRSQVPLILAWALSIHKAQGQTLERVKVDLGKVFEKGQAYVALSRATSMAGLQVLNFDARKVVAHDRVRNFYAQLSNVGPSTTNASAGTKKPGVSAGSYEREFVRDEWADEGPAYAYG